MKRDIGNEEKEIDENENLDSEQLKQKEETSHEQRKEEYDKIKEQLFADLKEDQKPAQYGYKPRVRPERGKLTI